MHICMTVPGDPSVSMHTCMTVPGDPSVSMHTCMTVPGHPNVSMHTCMTVPGDPSVSMHTCMTVPGDPSVFSYGKLLFSRIFFFKWMALFFCWYAQFGFNIYKRTQRHNRLCSKKAHLRNKRPLWRPPTFGVQINQRKERCFYLPLQSRQFPVSQTHLSGRVWGWWRGEAKGADADGTRCINKPRTPNTKLISTEEQIRCQPVRSPWRLHVWRA